MKSDTSQKLFAEASRYIPGGVNSPVRAWTAVGGEPRFIERASGSTITDADGNTYIDYIGSWGPMIVGHAHHAVLRALSEVMKGGTSFGAPTAREVELGRRITGALPSVEQVRLVSSGTEATMTALRLARAFTGRRRCSTSTAATRPRRCSAVLRAAREAMTTRSADSPGGGGDGESATLVARFKRPEGDRGALSRRGARRSRRSSSNGGPTLGVPPAASAT